MKVREGFVSNSSSSSFVCSICGDSQVGYDGQYDIRVWCCSHGHEFCEECMPRSPGKIADELAKDIESAIMTLELDVDEAKELRERGSHDERKDWILKYITYDDLDSNVCPVCNLEAMPDFILITYLCEKIGMNLEEVSAEIRSQYKNLNAWKKRPK